MKDTDQFLGHAEALEALAKVKQKSEAFLFPNSPIEITAEERYIHVYVEGVWDSKERSIRDANTRIREVIKVHREIWDHSKNFINPEWAGWKNVQVASMLELIGAV